MAKEIVIPSNPAELKTILAAIKEMSDCMYRIAAEKDAMKDIVDDLAEKYELPKKYINKMAKVHHKASFDKETVEHDDFADLYVAVTEVK
jgi:hypothetical protein